MISNGKTNSVASFVVNSSHNVNKLRDFLFIDCTSAKSIMPTFTNNSKPPQITYLMKQMMTDLNHVLIPYSLNAMSSVSPDVSFGWNWVLFQILKRLHSKETIILHSFEERKTGIWKA